MRIDYLKRKYTKKNKKEEKKKETRFFENINCWKSRSPGKNQKKEKRNKKDSRLAEDQGVSGSERQGRPTHGTTAGGDEAGAGGDDGGDEERRRKKTLPADKIEEGPRREKGEEEEKTRKKVYLKPSKSSIQDLMSKPFIKKKEEDSDSSFDDNVRDNGFDPSRQYEVEWAAAVAEDIEENEDEDDRDEDDEDDRDEDDEDGRDE